jgi:hypothetical protein
VEELGEDNFADIVRDDSQHWTLEDILQEAMRRGLVSQEFVDCFNSEEFRRESEV